MSWLQRNSRKTTTQRFHVCIYLEECTIICFVEHVEILTLNYVFTLQISTKTSGYMSTKEALKRYAVFFYCNVSTVEIYNFLYKSETNLYSYASHSAMVTVHWEKHSIAWTSPMLSWTPGDSVM